MAAHKAALAALVVAILVALIVYSMPVGQALDSALLGAVFGLFPIMWIVWNAIWIYNMTVATGHFAVLRRSFGRISDDQRVQAVIIAFCFGALLEALAGFGTPVAITAVMLIALGFQPIKAASVALVANTAPVAFGAIAIPIITLAEITGLPKEDLGAMVGRQTPLLALFVPLVLVGMVDGMRGVRQAWPAAIVGGFVFAFAQFACSNYVSVELTDIVAALLSPARSSPCSRSGSRREPIRGEGPARGPAVAGAAVTDPALEAEVRRKYDDHADSRGEIIARLRALRDHHRGLRARAVGADQGRARGPTKEFTWPGLDVTNADGEPVSAIDVQVQLADAAGTLLLLSGLLTMLVLRVNPAARAEDLRRDARPAQVGDGDGRGGAGARLRDEPVRPDHHARPVDRRRGRHPRLPVLDHRLAGRRRDRLGHELQLAVRRPPGVGREGGRPRPDAARRGQLAPAACWAR